MLALDITWPLKMSASDLHPFRTGTIVPDDETRAALRSVGSAGSDADFNDFLDTALSSLVLPAVDGGGSLQSHRILAGSPSAHQTANAFEALLLDYARCNTPISVATNALEEIGFKGARAKRVAESVSSRAESIRSQLVRAGACGAAVAVCETVFTCSASHALCHCGFEYHLAGAALPAIVDLKWRLDYLVSSKGGGKLGTPMYLIDMHLDDPVKGLVVQQFTCTPPELEELRGKVKDALRAAAALAAAAT